MDIAFLTGPKDSIPNDISDGTMIITSDTSEAILKDKPIKVDYKNILNKPESGSAEGFAYESNMADINTAQDALDYLFRRTTEMINIVPSLVSNLTYNGEEQTPEWNNYNAEKLDISGDTSATAAGTYTAVFTPKEGYLWEDNTKTGKSVTWTIDKVVIENIPSQKNTLVYNGTDQSPEWNNYDPNKMIWSGTKSRDNAGIYNSYFTPKDNYKWSDGTSKTIEIFWTIDKAVGSLSIDKTSIDLTVTHNVDTITVIRPGDGIISATSSNTNIATVSITYSAITVTGIGSGDAIITINVAEGSNYYAPSAMTCSVNVSLINSTLADNTPAQIQAAAKQGIAQNYWSVGDKIPITLNGTVGRLELNGTYYAFILGFNHNADIEGNNTIHFMFGKTEDGTKDICFVDDRYDDNTAVSPSGTESWFKMNHINATSGGWKDSFMRNNICSTFINLMPVAWQNVITSCTKYTDNKGNSSSTTSKAPITATQDYIFIPSEFEIFGVRSYANENEQNYQAQYAYYQNGSSKQKNKYNSTSEPVVWWTRSLKQDNGIIWYCYVGLYGASSSSSKSRVVIGGGARDGEMNQSHGFAPCFAVG